jgi:hypothetical protein
MSPFATRDAGRAPERKVRPALGTASLLIHLATNCFGAVLPAHAAPFSLAQPVRVAPEVDYGPFVFSTEEGPPQGLSIDFLKLIEKKTGLLLAMTTPQSLSLTSSPTSALRLPLTRKGRGFLRRYAVTCAVASVGSCFTEWPDCADSPQANKRYPRSKTLIAPTTSA